MAYSSLKRKTPLKAKGGLKPSCGFKKKPAEQQPARTEKKPQRARKSPSVPRRSERSSLETHLDIVFSLYIRLRDAMDGGRTRCISCGNVFPFEKIQAGHYFTRHNMSVRWDVDNVHSQCFMCNCHESGNIESYTPRLVAKIGQERYDALCARAREARKWSGDELRDMIRLYTKEARRLSKEKGINVKI